MIHGALLAWGGLLCLKQCLDGLYDSKNIHMNTIRTLCCSHGRCQWAFAFSNICFVALNPMSANLNSIRELFCEEEDDHLGCRRRYKAPSYWPQREQNITQTDLPSQDSSTTCVPTEKAVTCDLQFQFCSNTASWLVGWQQLLLFEWSLWRLAGSAANWLRGTS